MKKFLYLFSILILSSCIKDEIPITKTPGSKGSKEVTISSNSYQNQVFYSLSKGEIYSQNDREIWDLGFENTAEGDKIILNTSKVMGGFKSDFTSFSDISNDQGIVYTPDQPNGVLSQTIIGDWTDGKIYYINRGVKINGTSLGKIKLKVISVDSEKFVIEWAPINSGEIITSIIPKGGEGNFTYFSFDNNGQVVTVEDNKKAWDICFTSYMHIYEDGMPYNVFAPILNRHNTRAAKIEGKDFKDINYQDYLSANVSSDINSIGFEWKTYNFDTGIYDVNSNMSFVIQTSENKIYKLRFLDFYDINGVKGAPTMEYEEMFSE